MKYVLVALIGCLPIFMASCKGEGKKVNAAVTSLPEAVEKVENIFRQRLGFKEIKCPRYTVSNIKSRDGLVEQRCFVSKSEPEDLLAAFSQEVANLGEVQMQWRFDIGQWVSSYALYEKRYELLIALRAPGQSSYMEDDPAVKDYGTLGIFYLQEKPSKTKPK